MLFILHNAPKLFDGDAVHQALHGQAQLGVVLDRVEARLVVHGCIGGVVRLQVITK